MNSSRRQINFYLLILISLVVMSFNNCAPGHFVAMTTRLASEIPPESMGAQLYNTNCSICHGQLNISSKRGVNASAIQSAIQTEEQMFALSVLNSVEIGMIADALNGVTPPTGTTKPSQFIAPVKNRFMLKAHLKEIFIVDSGMDTNDTNINTIIENLIGDKPEAFAGNCSRYDAGCMASNCGAAGDGECVGKHAGNITAAAIPVLSTISIGLMIRACEEILAIDKAVNTALSKAKLSATAPVNDENLTQVLKFFYHDDVVSAAAVAQLAEQNLTAKSKGYSGLDQWRFILLPLCTSTTTNLL